MIKKYRYIILATFVFTLIWVTIQAVYELKVKTDQAPHDFLRYEYK